MDSGRSIPSKEFEEYGRKEKGDQEKSCQKVAEEEGSEEDREEGLEAQSR